MAKLSKKDILDCDIIGSAFLRINIGTMDNLIQEAGFIRTMRGIIASALEETAYRYKMIDKEQLLKVAEKYEKFLYGYHLKMVADGRMIITVRWSRLSSKAKKLCSLK